jgi:hypothetical protein
MKPITIKFFSLRLATFTAFLVAAAGAGAALSGCSKDDASAQCGQFLEDFCTKVASCNSTATKEGCKLGLMKNIDCSKAVEAPSNFDKCPSDIQALKCTGGVPAVPASCDISFRK